MSRNASASLADTPSGYGIVTRSLHWVMAGLFAWQFTLALAHMLAPETAVNDLFRATHFSVGFTIYIFALIRGAWGLYNMRRRPSKGGSALAWGASLGQGLLYLLMIVVPLLAIMRAAASGRGLLVYGIQLVAPGGAPNPNIVALGNALHAPLAWLLLLLVGGHIAMALIHGLVWKDGTIERMTRQSRA